MLPTTATMRLSLRRKFLLLTWLFLAMFVGLVTLTNIQTQERAAQRRLVDKVDALASLIAKTSANPLAQLDVFTLRLHLADVNGDEEVAYAFILDEEGAVVTDGTMANPHRGRVPEHLSQAALLRSVGPIQDARGELAIAEPIQIGDRRIGTVVLGISQDLMRKAVDETRNANLLVGVGFAVLGMGAVGLLVTSVTRPLERLVRAASEVSAGRLDVRLKLATGDELEVLADTFNQMLARLEQTTVSRDELEQRVLDRTVALGAANEQLSKEVQERERAELELERLARAPYEATAFHLADGLAIVDTEQRVQFWNKRMEELLGIAPETAVGRCLLEVKEPAFRRTTDPETARSEESGAIHAALSGTTGRTLLSLHAPIPRDLDTLFFPVPGRDGLEGFGLLTRDVTRERELDRMKDELIATVSHELRTPLASLVGFSELLLTREFPEARRREFLETMLQEGRRLTALLGDFLDLQRLQSGLVRLRAETVDLGDVLRRAVDVAGNDAADPLALEVDEHLPSVRADPDRVQQVLANLISNACKYSPNGGTIRLTAHSSGNRMVEVAVHDQGLGLPPEALTKLFQRFYRVDSAQHRGIGGAGLGLAICREIVEAHGGTIRAESPGPGQGSTFRFTLPAAT